MAGKCGHAGVAGGETGALIGADGRDSHIITISQLFTCLHLWQHRGLDGVTREEIIFPCEFACELHICICLFLQSQSIKSQNI